jgi:hypothetical protein
LHQNLRLAYLIAAALLLLLLPIGHASVVLVLFVAADLGAAALLLDPETAEPVPVIALGGDMASLDLIRRTAPALRSRRPIATVEAQVRWREAVEARRQVRIVS